MNFGDRCPWCGLVMERTDTISISKAGEALHARCADIRAAKIRRDRKRADAPPKQATGI